MGKRGRRLVWTPVPLTCESFLFLQNPLNLGPLMVLINPHTYKKTESCGAIRRLRNTSCFPFSAYSLAVLRAWFPHSDCCRKPRIAKDHCVTFAQSTPPDTLAPHDTASPVLPLSPPDFNTPGYGGPGSLIKGGQAAVCGQASTKARTAAWASEWAGPRELWGRGDGHGDGAVCQEAGALGTASSPLGFPQALWPRNPCCKERLSQQTAKDFSPLLALPWVVLFFLCS